MRRRLLLIALGLKQNARDLRAAIEGRLSC